jgi:ectoine hydroxylase-related dioxygenase (phytanoyl-CoA dioxygenase family)
MVAGREHVALDAALAALAEPPTSHGHRFETAPSAFGELRDSSGLRDDVAGLRRRMDEDGYLLLRGYLDVESVLAARGELCEKLASVGLIDRRRPATEAVFSGSTAGVPTVDRKAFAHSLRTGAAVRALCHGPAVLGFYERFLGGAPLAYKYIWVRNVRVGAATGVHFDWVYMGRGTRNLYTSWIPIGDVPLSDGPLVVLEGSHRIAELQGTYGALDVDRDKVWEQKEHKYAGGWLTKDVRDVQARFGGRWLTTEFRAGDMLLFGMFTLHCSIDNRSPENRIRLSTDSRYQLASEPADERWVGEEPFGHGMM